MNLSTLSETEMMLDIQDVKTKYIGSGKILGAVAIISIMCIYKYRIMFSASQANEDLSCNEVNKGTLQPSKHSVLI